MSRETDNPQRKTWLKRLGWGAFLFFLIKGLAWLAVGYFGLSQLSACNP